MLGDRRRLAGLLGALVAALAAGWIGHGELRAAPSRDQTPRQWFDAYMAAAVDDPGRVCHVLLSPPLAAGYKSRGGCEAVYRSADDRPVTVTAVLYGRGRAVLELRNRHGEHRHWHITLARDHHAWRATGIYAGP